MLERRAPSSVAAHLYLSAILCGCFFEPAVAMSEEFQDVVLVIHGGTSRGRETSSPEKEQRMRAVMTEALQAGYDALQRPDATSLDGVEAAIRVLEDSPAFNAGRGAVFTSDERIELDASIMNGRTLEAGAVAGVTTVKNPIVAARTVMLRSPHVLLIGDGAEQFCREQKLELVDPSYFRTDERLQELRRVQSAAQKANKASAVPPADDVEYGTVGAVALDRHGHLAAGTSTGGMTNKRRGRVGDSPIIGAGTYADDRACGVSCTGHGEFFIRLSVAHSIALLVRHKGCEVGRAADEVVQHDLKQAGGAGGVIVLDPRGRAAFSWNTPGLWRGYATRDGRFSVAVYDQ